MKFVGPDEGANHPTGPNHRVSWDCDDYRKPTTTPLIVRNMSLLSLS
jgi:hypothetical protein